MPCPYHGMDRRTRDRQAQGEKAWRFPNPKRSYPSHVRARGNAVPCPYHGNDGTRAGSTGAGEMPWPFPNPKRPYPSHVRARGNAVLCPYHGNDGTRAGSAVAGGKGMRGSQSERAVSWPCRGTRQRRAVPLPRK